MSSSRWMSAIVGSTKTLVQAYVTSYVDYCNAVLAESPTVITNKLQRVMNSAARVVTNRPTMFTRSSKHQAIIKQGSSKHQQTSSKYEAYITHIAYTKQISSKHQVGLIRAHVVHVYFEYICLMVA